MTIYEKMNAISEKAQGKLKPDLLKIGNNFRAVSEAQLYDVLNPLLNEYGVFYEIELLNSEVKEFAVNEGSNKIHRFYASVQVRLTFNSCGEKPSQTTFDGLGMGIDDGDKCAGKAYTYAVKYALLKAFRLKFADDSDFAKSETYAEEGQTNKGGSGKTASKGQKTSKEKESSDNSRPRITEKMSEYLFGLCKRANVSDEQFFKKYSCYPTDKNIPMDIARNIIDELKKKIEDDLPF